MAGKETSAIRELTRDGRKKIIQLGYKAGHTGAHFAPSLSLVDVLTVLFTEVMDREKDLFVLSKGHGGLGYYVAMYEARMITEEQLLTFEDNGGDFPGQPSRSPENGITYSSGSLGLGLGYAAGRAQVEPERRLFCLLGDGELNEGSNWESAMYAGFHKLANLTAIVDYNKMQSDGASEAILEFDIDGAFRAMGWQTCSCDGHDPEAIYQALTTETDGRPLAVIAHTVKGKGISFMENEQAWHHNHLSEAQYQQALAELEEEA